MRGRRPESELRSHLERSQRNRRAPHPRGQGLCRGSRCALVSDLSAARAFLCYVGLYALAQLSLK